MTGLDRRKFLKRAGVATAGTGALWVTPSVLGLDQAFAVASCKVPTLTGWAATQVGAWQGGSGSFAGFAAGALGAPYNTAPFNTGTQPTFLSEQDPPAATYVYATVVGSYTSAAFALSANSTYTFTYNIRARDTQNHVATQQVEVQWATSTAGPWTTIGMPFQSTLHAGSPRDVRTDVTGATALLTTTTAATVFLRFAFSFQGTIGTANNARANDIAVTLPIVTCK